MTGPRAILLATLLLILAAAFTLLYGGFVPLFPGIVNRPEPVGAAALAAIALVAAIGVYREQPWGRWLGVAIGVVLLARDIGFVASGRTLELLTVGLDVLLLYLLLSRVPSPKPRADDPGARA